MTELERALEYIKEANHIVFFGGAGVSTESGIPDFRSKDGLYNQHDINFAEYEPEYLLSRDCLYNNPKVFYEFYRQKLDVRNVKPNITHRVLAKMEQTGKLDAVVTQNIDGLHQRQEVIKFMRFMVLQKEIIVVNVRKNIQPIISLTVKKQFQSVLVEV